jgi:hypothetical protein
MSNSLKLLAVAALAYPGLLVPLASTAKECRVLDSELQQHYQGGCKKGLAHGAGYATGTAEYEGEFRNGMKHGRGLKRWYWGDYYEGNFLADRRQGQGMYVWGEGSPWAGERYVGGFRADRRDGWGVYYWANGDRFEGQWKEDLRYGQTAMEQRRLAARKAREQALAIAGTTVCSSIPVGIALRTQLRGKTEGVEKGRVKVRITGVSEAGPSAKPAVDIGMLLLTEVWEWGPCL